LIRHQNLNLRSHGGITFFFGEVKVDDTPPFVGGWDLSYVEEEGTIRLPPRNLPDIIPGPESNKFIKSIQIIEEYSPHSSSTPLLSAAASASFEETQNDSQGSSMPPIIEDYTGGNQ
jgi:hypothetical protein